MFKNHALEWILNRFTGIWLTFSLFFFLYLFIINFQTIGFDVLNGNSLILIFWDSWASSNLNWFVKFFFFLSFIILFIHLFQGVQSVLQDYVHNEKTKYFSEILIKLIQIESLKFFYIFLFF